MFSGGVVFAAAEAARSAVFESAWRTAERASSVWQKQHFNTSRKQCGGLNCQITKKPAELAIFVKNLIY